MEGAALVEAISLQGGRYARTTGADDSPPLRCATMSQEAYRRAVRCGALAAVVLGGACDAADSRTPIDVEALGPQVGEQVPGFGLPDQNGQVFTLDSVLGPNGAILMFHRSADW